MLAVCCLRRKVIRRGVPDPVQDAGLYQGKRGWQTRKREEERERKNVKYWRSPFLFPSGRNRIADSRTRVSQSVSRSVVRSVGRPRRRCWIIDTVDQVIFLSFFLSLQRPSDSFLVASDGTCAAIHSVRLVADFQCRPTTCHHPVRLDQLNIFRRLASFLLLIFFSFGWKTLSACELISQLNHFHLTDDVVVDAKKSHRLTCPTTIWSTDQSTTPIHERDGFTRKTTTTSFFLLPHQRHTYKVFLLICFVLQRRTFQKEIVGSNERKESNRSKEIQLN